MIMFVIVDVLSMNMNMGMGMRMLVGMNQVSMAVFMGMGVGMLMGMLQFDRILNHKISADNHHNQGSIELDCRSFSQNQHAKCHTKERGD